MTPLFTELDERLQALWRQRDTLTAAQWEELYRTVQRILRSAHFPEYHGLPGIPRRDYVDQFFAERVFLSTKRDAYPPHAGALRMYYRRYLQDLLRRRAADPLGAKRVAAHVDDEHAQRHADSGFAHAMRLAPSPGAEQKLGEYGLTFVQVRDSAAAFLEAQESWVRLYLQAHFCAGKEEARPLSAVAERYRIASYHYRARQLGISWPRGGFAHYSDYGETLIGRWMRALLAAGSGDDVQIMPEHHDLMALLLEILCATALSITNNRGGG